MKNADYIKHFGKNIRSIRRDRDISQQQLAVESDLSLSQVSRIERGLVNTSLNHILCIALALGVHPKELWNFDYDFKGEETCQEF